MEEDDNCESVEPISSSSSTADVMNTIKGMEKCVKTKIERVFDVVSYRKNKSSGFLWQKMK